MLQPLWNSPLFQPVPTSRPSEVRPADEASGAAPEGAGGAAGEGRHALRQGAAGLFFGGGHGTFWEVKWGGRTKQPG